jgi:2-phospho-L-lactate guanylyltransferase
MTPYARPADVWAVLPVKRLTLAKSRLGGVLAPAERRRLARAMLFDVLDAVRATGGLSGVLVVTADAEVARLAEGQGARILRDAFETGVNQAVAQATHLLTAEGRDGVVILPADVPLANPDELRAVLAAMVMGCMVLVPASGDGGTNLIAAAPPSLVDPCFGIDSFAKHVAAARGRGLEPKVMRLDGIGHDVDNPHDLLIQLGRGAPTRTRTLLHDFDVAARLSRPAHIRSGGPT